MNYIFCKTEGTDRERIRETFQKMKNLGYYSPEELLRLGREYAKNENYSEAKMVFEKLSETQSNFVGISDLYKSLILAISSAKFREKIHSRGHDSEFVVEKAIYCMAESTRMHAEKELSKDDLFTIEKLVDEIPFSEMQIPGREEFERIYGKFKEYIFSI